MRNLRYLVRLFVAFLSRFKVLIIIGIIIGIIFFFVIHFIFPRLNGWKTTKIGLAGRYSLSTLPLPIQRKISAGLTGFDDKANVVPALASSWSTPDKGKTWIFKIKNNATWQDGSKILSKQINYGFSDATISYPDEHTIEFSLQSPYSAFPAVVARPIFKEGLLGTGEWKVTNLNLVSDYINQLTIENNNTRQKTVYKFYPTEENTKLAFELGEIEEIDDLLDPEPLTQWHKLKIEKSTNDGEYVALFFNTTDKFLSDKTLRQALSYGTLKDNLGGVRAISPIQETSWAYNPQVKPYAFDKEKSKNMISTLPREVKNNLNITLTTSPLLLPQAEEIQKNWKDIGVNANINVVSNIPTNYQALLAIFDVPDDPDQYSIWHSTQTSTNITHYSNPRIDKLLEDGRSTLSISDRKQIYFDFQRFLLEDAPAIFLYYPSVYKISR